MSEPELDNRGRMTRTTCPACGAEGMMKTKEKNTLQKVHGKQCQPICGACLKVSFETDPDGWRVAITDVEKARVVTEDRPFVVIAVVNPNGTRTEAQMMVSDPDEFKQMLWNLVGETDEQQELARSRLRVALWP